MGYVTSNKFMDLFVEQSLLAYILSVDGSLLSPSEEVFAELAPSTGSDDAGLLLRKMFGEN